MHRIDFWFDPVSPYAYLAFERLPQALEGLSVEVRYRPVLFAGLLAHWGQKGPAEVGPKRDWTYRQVLWIAHHHGMALDLPAVHPFNPLALLRLAWACVDEGDTPNRRVCELLLHHVWQGGGVADDAARLAALTQRLAPRRDPADEAVKQALRAATDDAIARGVFGVPSVQATRGGAAAGDARLFWGFDALEMVAAFLHGDAWFDGPQWRDAAALPMGVVRRVR